MQTVLPSETGDANRPETAEQCRQGVGWFWFWLISSLVMKNRWLSEEGSGQATGEADSSQH